MLFNNQIVKNHSNLVYFLFLLSFVAFKLQVPLCMYLKVYKYVSGKYKNRSSYLAYHICYPDSVFVLVCNAVCSYMPNDLTKKKKSLKLNRKKQKNFVQFYWKILFHPVKFLLPPLQLFHMDFCHPQPLCREGQKHLLPLLLLLFCFALSLALPLAFISLAYGSACRSLVGKFSLHGLKTRNEKP